MLGLIIGSVNKYTPAAPAIDYEVLALFLVVVGIIALAVASDNTPFVVDLAGRMVWAGLTGA